MAKNADAELFRKLREGGLRRRVARQVAGGLDSARDGSPPRVVQDVVAQLKALTAEIEDRAKGGPAKRRSEAAQKAAATRRRKASQRSTAARKAARTRASAR